MKRIFLSLCLLFCAVWSARATLADTVALLFTPTSAVIKTAAVTFTGPGDQVASALVWYSASRAYSTADRGNKLMNVCNSTGGVDVGCADMVTDATTGALVPQTISAITCPGANCTVKTFYDRSGGAKDITQSVVASRATLTASCTGSIPCAVCAGGCVYTSAGTVAQSQPYSSAWVGERTGATSSYGVMIASVGVGTETGFGASTNRVFIYGPPELDMNSVADNSPHACQIVFNGASSSINCDSASQVTGTSSAVSMSGFISILGNNGSLQLTGDFFESGWWPVGFTGTNITNLNSNAHSYYGF
jgi:hypothetical protein